MNETFTMANMAETFAEILSRLQNPSNIFYWPYILCSYVIAFTALLIASRMKTGAALKTLFDRKIWLTRSTGTDIVVSTFYMLFFNIPTNAIQAFIAIFAYREASLVFRKLPAYFTIELSSLSEGLMATGLSILAFDLATYASHLAMHKIGFLWDIHVIHHTPSTLNMFSAYRQNPLDRLIRNSLGGLLIGIAFAVFHYFFRNGTGEIAFMGIGAGFFVFMLTVHLQHSHIPVHYPSWLGRWWLSPHLHQIHHSSLSRHRDKNFGGIFPFWDRMFGTLHDERLEIGAVPFGVENDPIQNSIVRCYFYPLISWFGRIRRATSVLTQSKVN